MSNSEKLLKSLSTLIENGILTSKDIQKEISTDLKFTRDKSSGTKYLFLSISFILFKFI